MMTKKEITSSVKTLKEQFKATRHPMEQEMILQKIRALKVHGLMLMDERNEHNQKQYTDGNTIYLIDDANRFIRKDNGKIGIESYYVVKEA